MHVRHPLALAFGTIVLVALTPALAPACHWWGRHHRPVYHAPAPMYVAPPMYYAPVPPPHHALPGSVAPMPPAASTSAAAVRAGDNRFDPPTLTVAPGTTVRWTNTGEHPHTVTDRGGKFDSGDVAPGGTFSVTFRTAGTYRYYCKHHKGMEGTIVVGTPGPAPASGSGTGASKY